MANREISSIRRLKWVALICVAVVVLAAAWFIASLNKATEPAVPQSGEAMEPTVTLEMINGLNKRIDDVSSAIAALRNETQALHAQHASIETAAGRRDGEIRDLRERAGRFNASLEGMLSRFDEMDSRLLQLEQAAEAAKEQASEPASKVTQPVSVSGLVRWGGRELAIVKTPAGRQALGVGDQLSDWQVIKIGWAEGTVTLRNLESGQEVIRSFREEPNLNE